MRLRIDLFGAARDAAGADRVEVQLPEGADVSALLGELTRRYGAGFRSKVLREDGTVWPTVAILANGTNVSLARGLATALSDGDQVSIVPVISGGWAATTS